MKPLTDLASSQTPLLVERANIEAHHLLYALVFVALFFVCLEPLKGLMAILWLRLKRDFELGDSLIFQGGREGEVTRIGPFHITLVAKNGNRVLIPGQKILTEPYEVQSQKHGIAVVLSLPANDLSRQQVERVAHLCPYKRKDTDVRVSHLDGEYKISMEISHRDTRPWVYRYFEESLNS